MKISSEILDDNKIKSKKSYMTPRLFFSGHVLNQPSNMKNSLLNIRQTVQLRRILWFETIRSIT